MIRQDDKENNTVSITMTKDEYKEFMLAIDTCIKAVELVRVLKELLNDKG